MPTSYHHRAAEESNSRARILSEMERRVTEQAYISGREDSVDLIRYSAARGMSLRRMYEIWGRGLVDLAL